MSHNQIVSLLNGKIRDRDAEITRLTADRDEALTIADRHRLTCQGVEEDFHALEESNERLRTALAVCVTALEPFKTVAISTDGDPEWFGNGRQADKEAITIHSLRMGYFRKARTAWDAGKAALTKDS